MIICKFYQNIRRHASLRFRGYKQTTTAAVMVGVDDDGERKKERKKAKKLSTEWTQERDTLVSVGGRNERCMPHFTPRRMKFSAVPVATILLFLKSSCRNFFRLKSSVSCALLANIHLCFTIV